MDQLRNVAVVVNVHGHLLAFLYSEQRPRRAAVVSNSLDYLAGASSRLTGAIRSEKCATSAICLKADVEEETFRLLGKEQPGEKTDAPDNADTPAKRRKSRRFMTTPSMAMSYQQYSAVAESHKAPAKILYKRNESSIWSFDYDSTVANFSACADANAGRATGGVLGRMISMNISGLTHGSHCRRLKSRHRNFEIWVWLLLFVELSNAPTRDHPKFMVVEYNGLSHAEMELNGASDGCGASARLVRIPGIAAWFSSVT